MSDRNVQGVKVIDGTVLPEWIDINNHMNVAYYVLAFDQAVDALWEDFGITENYINASSSSTFAVESHITWQRELGPDAPFVITAQLLAYDGKRIHQFMRMYHAEERYLAATAEWLNLHVDLKLRKVSPWPPAILREIAGFAERQGQWPWPKEAGKQMSVPQPIFSSRDQG